MRFPGGLKKVFTLSYDDGVEQDIRLIEMFDKYGLKATFNLNSGCYSPEGVKFKEGQVHRRLTEADATALYGKNGHEVATHAYTHPWLEKLSSANVAYEIIKDREALEKQFGCIVRGHAYPYGTYNDTVVETLRACGIAYARTVQATKSFEIPTDWLRLHPTCHHDHPEIMALIDKFLELKNERGAKMFYLWGHSYEFEQKNNWEHIEQICEKIANKNDIWYANNIDIYNYVMAYNSLVFSSDMSCVYNPSGMEIFFSLNSKEICVKSGETLKL